MTNQEVIQSVRKYLLELVAQGLPVSYGIIFGSHVNGRPHEWSDIDLFVVSPRFDETHSRTDINLLWRTAARVDNRIEPLAVGKRQYAKDRATPIIEIARREGEIVKLSQEA